MARIPYNPFKGQEMKSDAPNKPVDRAYLVRYHLSATEAAAADVDGILPETELTTARTITTGFNNPPAPRALTYDCTAAGVTGSVKVYGTNVADEAITETKALNGSTVVPGVVAFKTITKIDLPVKAHTKAKQTETITVTKAPTSNGNVTFALTAAAMGDASPKTVTVAVTTALDDVTKTAAAVVAALNADKDVGGAFVATNDQGVITITAKVEAANDTTLAFVFDASTTGMTCGSSTNGTAGVAPDLVFIGFGDIIGLPYKSTWKNCIYPVFNGILEANACTQVVDADDVEKNTVDLNSALDGSTVDLYLVIDNE
jgi:hypothetical protein